MSGSQAPLTWIDGEPEARLSPLDRGFAYGDGLFETCRVHRGTVPLQKQHLERLVCGAQALRLNLNAERLDRYLDRVKPNLRDGVLKIQVTRGLGGRGYVPPEKAEPTIVVIYYPAVVPLPVGEPGLRVCICEQRVSQNPSLAGLKHLNRLDSVLASAEWREAGFDEGLLMDAQGQLIEATAHNLLLFCDGVWVTPLLETAGVKGVARRLVMEQLATRCGERVETARLSPADLSRAQEALLCNSVRGFRPVDRVEAIGGNLLSAKLTRERGDRLQQAFIELMTELSRQR